MQHTITVVCPCCQKSVTVDVFMADGKLYAYTQNLKPQVLTPEKQKYLEDELGIYFGSVAPHGA